MPQGVSGPEEAMGMRSAMKAPESDTPRARRRVPRPLAVLAVLTIAVCGIAACGNGGTGPALTPSAATSTATASTTVSVPTTASAPAPPATTPGEAVQVPFGAGAVLAVVGVSHDDVLPLRRGPATTFPAVATLGPVAEGMISTGRGWRAEGMPWWIEVSTADVTGWADLRFLAGRDGTDDATAQVIRRLDSRPVAETMLDLGRMVAEAMASREPPSSIVMSVAPSVADLGEVTYDVVGLGDDSVRAERLHVFGQPTGSGEGFSLKSVEATHFCARGSSTGGLCP
jgi:hypothetical protein